MRFSERMGIKSVRESLQINGMDLQLRNDLWNLCYMQYFSRIKSDLYLPSNQSKYAFCIALWANHYHALVESMPTNGSDYFSHIKSLSLGEKSKWYELYDLIEFMLEHADINNPDDFRNYCNNVLARNKSGFRLVDNSFVRIVSDAELTEIGESQNNGNQLVQKHINSALRLISDRNAPDYRNSIKESISAVEAKCRELTQNEDATLGDGLKALEKTGNPIHPAMKTAFSCLYGYTNDADGIRHALKIEDEADFDTAKFMLVSCSAFINLLTSRSIRSKE